MPVEGPIDDISGFNPAWPLDSDIQRFTDDHVRLVKDGITKQFTDLAANGGVVTVTAAELNYLQGLNGNIQNQLNAIGRLWRYSADAAISALENEKLLIDPPVGGTVVTLPESPTQGSEIQIIDASGLAEPPDNTITFERSGTNVINDITQGFNNMTQITLQASGQQYTLAYYANVWYAWAISGWTA